MHGLVYLGTNGELALLTHEERQNIIRTARKAVTDLGIPDYPIVAGISAQSTVETIQCAREAADAGAGWALLLPPSYWTKALPSDALVAYYRDVADASPIPVIVYNVSYPTYQSSWKETDLNKTFQFPGVTSGIDLDSDQLSALSSHPNIVATKLTCGNVGKLTRLTSKFEPQYFGVYGGSSDYLLPTLHAGGNGCVTGLGNCFPKSTAKIYDYWAAGRLDEAKELQNLVANAEWACKKSLACTKYGAWWYVGKSIGLDDEKMFKMRKPYVELKDDVKKWTIETMKVLEEMEKSLPGRKEP